MSSPGKLTVRPIKAVITRNTEWFGNMDPFVEIQFQNQKQVSEVSKGGGKNPSWNNSLHFNRLSATLLSISLYDHESFKSHDLIGNIEIDISDIFIKTEPTTRQVELDYDGKISARIWLEFVFKGIDSNQSVNRGNGSSLMMSKRSKLGARQNGYQQPEPYNRFSSNQVNPQNQMYQAPRPYNNHPLSSNYNNQQGNEMFRSFPSNQNPNNQNNWGVNNYDSNSFPPVPYMAEKRSSNDKQKVLNFYEQSPINQPMRTKETNPKPQGSTKGGQKRFTADQMDGFLD